MSQASREVEIRFTVDDREVTAGTRRVKREVRDVGDETDKAGSKVAGGWGAARTAMAGFAGAAAFELGSRAIGAVSQFVGGSVRAASDLGETLNKSNAIFGDQAGVMRSWAKTAATSFGLSQSEALGYAAQLGDMGRQLGLTSKQAAGFGQDLVGVAADLGSFNNLETGDVLDRINAAMRGEYDSLQALIPNINAARVEQEALAATGKKSAKELTAQEKALAVQAILHKDGARAMGDFAKTSGGFANQQKILAAQLDDVQAQLGQALLPVLQAVMGFITSTAVPALSEFTTWFTANLAPAIGQFAQQLTGLAPVMQGLAGFLAQNASWLLPVATGITAVVLAVKAWTIAQGFLNTALRANPIGLVITVIGLLVTAFITAYQNSETFRNIVDNTFRVIKSVVLTVGNAVVGAIRAIVDWLVNAWHTAVDFGVRVVRAFRDVNSRVINFVKGMVTGVINFFRSLVDNGVRLVTTLRDRFIRANQVLRDSVVRAAQQLRDRVVNFFTSLRDRGVALVTGLRDRSISFARSLRDGLANLVTQARDRVVSRFTSMRDRAVAFVSSLRDRVFSFMRSLRDGIATIVGQARDFAVSRFNSLRDRAVGVVTRVRDSVTRGFRLMRDSVKSIFTGMRDTVGRVFSGLLDKVKGPLRSVFSWLNRNLISPLNSVTSKFGLNIPDLPRFHKGGPVGGRGEVPAVLLGGEGVLSRRGMRNIGGRRGLDLFNAGGPGDWLKQFTEFIGTPAKLLQEMAQRGVKWAVNAVLGAIGNVPGSGVPIVDAIPGLLRNLREKVQGWAAKTEQQQEAALGTTGGGSIGSGPWVKPVGAGIGNGYLGYPGHYGVDMPVGTGTRVHAVSNAVVTKAASLTYSYGKHLFLRHADGLVTVYAHLSRLLAGAGQRVNTGQVIGLSGSTGNSSGPHLHFETRVGGGYPGPNPRSVMAARGVTLDSGGFLMPGLTLVRNATGQPEPVLNPSQWKDLRNGGRTVIINVNGAIDPVSTAKQIKRLLDSDTNRSYGVTTVRTVARG